MNKIEKENIKRYLKENKLTDDEKRYVVKEVRKGWRNYCLTLIVLSGANMVFWFFYMGHHCPEHEWPAPVFLISLLVFVCSIRFAWESFVVYRVGKAYVALKSVTNIEDYFK